jgi:hemolysin activation/secretion protein
LTLAGGVTFTKQRYDKDDYAAKHSIAAGFSTEGNMKIAYNGRFHEAIKKWDILLNASAADPEFHNNFFGLGNSTIKDDNLEAADYYEIQYSNFNISTGLSREFWRNSVFNLLVGLESINSKKLDHSTVLDSLNAPGAFKILNILPIEIDLDLDFRDERGLPYNGARFYISYTNGTILNEESTTNKVLSYGYLDGFIEYYISTVNERKVTFGMRFGGSKGYGDIPFYKMPNLGGTNGLRGYTGQRFTGDSRIYFNSELRWQFLYRYTALFPVKMGVKAFFDTGRVYYDGAVNESNKWHMGYGGGIYVVPFKEAFMLSISVGFSEEESFYPIIGFGAPLR